MLTLFNALMIILLLIKWSTLVYNIASYLILLRFIKYDLIRYIKFNFFMFNYQYFFICYSSLINYIILFVWSKLLIEFSKLSLSGVFKHVGYKINSPNCKVIIDSLGNSYKRYKSYQSYLCLDSYRLDLH